MITRNCNNLIIIQTQTPQENRNEAGTTEKYFVPSVLLSNTMSLTPKIDEVAFAIKQNQCDIAAITETWLKESIPDVSVNIEGYQLFRKDRKNKEHGGVCLYVINHIQCKILAYPYNGDYEVLWALLRPKRLPRGYSSIIVGVLYHPPNADNNEMLHYLRTSMEYFEANYTNCGIILLGDFNKLDFKFVAKCFQLKPIINFPTRGLNILDQVFTNLKEYYNSPVAGPPFGLSDHITVTIFPAIRKTRQTQKKVVINSR